MFAIFPLDEQNSDRYLGFIEQRFQCVIVPLRLFVAAIERDIKQSSSSLKYRQTPRDASYEREQERLQQRDNGSDSGRSSNEIRGITREQDLSLQAGGVTSRDPNNKVSREVISLRGSQSARTRQQASKELSTSDSVQECTLKSRINQISEQYVEEGLSIKEAVMERLEKCRKDTRTLYRWAQASLMDLHDIIDESLADELYFMVRGKMARILSTISIFEEAADQIERNLSSHFPNGLNGPNGLKTDSKLATEETARFQNGSLKTERAVRDPTGAVSNNNHPPPRGMGEGKEDNDDEELDLRIEIPDRDSPEETTDRVLDDMMLSWSFSGDSRVNTLGTVHLVAEKPESEWSVQSQDSTPRSGSTPEPPISPRPRALAYHPKIMKLQSMALPSKFGGPNGNRFSASW